ncbi:hypothetical protein [Micromonospora sp. M61]|nr:hypothetical protein [Micromonospora sp. M61]
MSASPQSSTPARRDGVQVGEGTNDILRTAVARALVRADLTV